MVDLNMQAARDHARVHGKGSVSYSVERFQE